MIANWLRIIARIGTLTLGSLIFLFALFSGAEAYGGGFMGVIKNAPNAFPWALILLAAIIALRWELIGGILVTLLGVIAAAKYVFFASGSTMGADPFVLLFIGLIPLFGSCFIFSARLRSKK